jgi:uncharacterized protein
MKTPRPPKVNARSLAALALAVTVGGVIGWLAHVPEPATEPPHYAGKLAPVQPPARRNGEPRPASPDSAALNPAPPVAPAALPSVPEASRALPNRGAPPKLAQPDNGAPKAAPPWQRYAVAAPPLDGRIPIALVIDDVGVDVARSRRAIDTLPAAVTLSLLPYGAAIDRQAGEARARGHEIIVHVSMEADARTVDPGPNALYTDLPPEEIARRFDWALSRFSGYVGFNNHMGSRFTSNEAGMRVVLEEAKRRGLLFLDSKTAPETIGARLSREFGVPFASRQVFLDNDSGATAVAKQLAQLETVARRDHGAIAIGHPHDGTLEALAAWIPTLEQRGFVLVPLTALVKAPGANASSAAGG